MSVKAHSKFSASGAERWFECSASVEASEGQPDRETEWSREGTVAHELLEEIMTVMIATGSTKVFYPQVKAGIPREMVYHVTNAANFILGLWAKNPGADIMVETRIYLPFIHKDMFGTFDGAVVDHFGTLHVFDFKYGAGHAVSAKENLQMIFYGLGLAFKHHWNFQRVRLWIIQPRIKGYDGPTFWDVPIEVLKSYEAKFHEAVWRVENEPEFKEGSWCHWCKAKRVCPLKIEGRDEKARELFRNNPIGEQNGKSKTVREEKHDPKEQGRSRQESSKKESKGAAQKATQEQRRLAKKGWQKIGKEKFYPEGELRSVNEFKDDPFGIGDDFY